MTEEGRSPVSPSLRGGRRSNRGVKQYPTAGARPQYILGHPQSVMYTDDSDQSATLSDGESTDRNPLPPKLEE